MQDRFRFRVWNIKEKEMIYNAEIAYDGTNYPTEWQIGENNNDGWIYCFADYLNREEDYKIMQCTGIKDKNGKLIYEGDILKDHRQEGGIVKWNNDSAGFAIYEILETGCFVGGLFDWLDKDTNYEVTGNIHENPELLESK